jgi:hypothetical protein
MTPSKAIGESQRDALCGMESKVMEAATTALNIHALPSTTQQGSCIFEKQEIYQCILRKKILWRVCHLSINRSCFL